MQKRMRIKFSRWTSFRFFRIERMIMLLGENVRINSNKMISWQIDKRLQQRLSGIVDIEILIKRLMVSSPVMEHRKQRA